jgi:hypothetical protein
MSDVLGVEALVWAIEVNLFNTSKLVPSLQASTPVDEANSTSVLNTSPQRTVPSAVHAGTTPPGWDEITTQFNLPPFLEM